MSVPIINLFQEWLTKQKKSQSTIKTYTSTIEKFDSWLIRYGADLSHLSKMNIQSYMDYLSLEKKRSASTIDKVYAIIRVFAHFLKKPEIVEGVHRKPKKTNIYQNIPEYLSDHEQLQLLKEIEQSEDIRTTTIVYMILHTGIRISELCNLNFSDIQIKNKTAIVFINGDKERIVPLSEDVIYYLNRYKESTGRNHGPLFISKQNKRLTVRSIQYMLKKYNVNPHKLRHTFCRSLIKKGLDISLVAQLAGHKDINITKRYTKETSA